MPFPSHDQILAAIESAAEEVDATIYGEASYEVREAPVQPPADRKVIAAKIVKLRAETKVEPPVTEAPVTEAVKPLNRDQKRLAKIAAMDAENAAKARGEVIPPKAKVAKAAPKPKAELPPPVKGKPKVGATYLSLAAYPWKGVKITVLPEAVEDGKYGPRVMVKPDNGKPPLAWSTAYMAEIAA
jgi:hypothetical protein